MADTPTSSSLASSGVLVPPPRFIGDYSADFPSMMQWFKDLTAYSQQQTETVSALQGTPSGSVNVNNLPDPAATNLAKSQQTANQAFLAAAAAAANTALSGSVTISDAATSADATFTTAQPDTNYQVQATVTGTTGTPASGSTTLSGITKTTTKATISVGVAPGAGASVTFDVTIIRQTT